MFLKVDSPDLHSLRGPPEQLLSKNASKIIVKHSALTRASLLGSRNQFGTFKPWFFYLFEVKRHFQIRIARVCFFICGASAHLRGPLYFYPKTFCFFICTYLADTLKISHFPEHGLECDLHKNKHIHMCWPKCFQRCVKQLPHSRSHITIIETSRTTSYITKPNKRTNS